MARHKPVARAQPPSVAEYRSALTELIDLIDNLDSARVAHRKAYHLQLLHGLTMQCVNATRAALILIEQGLITESAPLVRVALEHAVAVQWIVITPHGADHFRAQASYKSAKMHEVIRTAGLAVPEDVREYYANAPKQEVVKSLSEVRRMFREVDPSGWLYLQYAHLCGYVHPSATGVTAYLDVTRTPPGLLLHASHELRPMLLTLALSLAAATSAYLDLVKTKPHKAALTRITESIGVPMWFTSDGKPPQRDT